MVWKILVYEISKPYWNSNSFFTLKIENSYRWLNNNHFIAVIFDNFQIVKKKRSRITDINKDDFIGEKVVAWLLISKMSDCVENMPDELYERNLLNVICTLPSSFIDHAPQSLHSQSSSFFWWSIMKEWLWSRRAKKELIKDNQFGSQNFRLVGETELCTINFKATLLCFITSPGKVLVLGCIHKVCPS